jgi:REP element-mobilizing transposase RayT
MKKRHLIENGYYQIYNRGNRKRDTFYDNQDYEVFLNYVSMYSEKWGIGIITYCLINNHFHIVLKQHKKDSLPKFMHSVCTAYSMYINIKYDLVGHVFQGTYKSTYIDSYESLMNQIEYVINNPIKHGLVKDIKDYPWVKNPPELL